MGSRKSMPASSAMRASRRLSGQEPDQRSGTRVTARPEEQFGPNRPILSALPLYMAMRSRIEIWGASTPGPPRSADFRPAARRRQRTASHSLPRLRGRVGRGKSRAMSKRLPPTLSLQPKSDLSDFGHLKGAEIGQARFRVQAGERTQE